MTGPDGEWGCWAWIDELEAAAVRFWRSVHIVSAVLVTILAAAGVVGLALFG